MKAANDKSDAAADFSVVLGGPLYQLLRRSHLSGDAMELLHRRIIIISLFTWLPLLVLSVLDGQALSGNVAVPFLLDAEVHVRFLLAVPLLIAAELGVHQRMRLVGKQFLVLNLIPESAMGRFNAAIAAASRLRNSMLAEVILIAFIYVVGIPLWHKQWALDTTTWYGFPTADSWKFSLAGMWYGYVSLPVFQFFVLRWIFRMFIWTRFLWQVSRIELSLVPTHPDRVGGLGFLADTITAFLLIAVAAGTLLAGSIANRIFYLGAALPQFAVEILAFVAFLLCIVLGPLSVFSPQLVRSSWTGRREYGALAERYVRAFDAKWLRGGAPADEPLLGSADIQSLADMGNSFQVVQSMNFAPITKGAVLGIVAATLLPIAPLVLTMMPLDALLKAIAGIFF